MEKRVIVKQNAGFRILWLVSSLVIIAFWVFLMTLNYGWDAMLITCVFLLPMIAPIYYWRWELVLYKDRISFRRIFKRREYSYSQIKSVKEYDRGHQRYILINLSNGKKIDIWHTHMNYGKCRNELLRHMSIQYNQIW